MTPVERDQIIWRFSAPAARSAETGIPGRAAAAGSDEQQLMAAADGW